MPEKSGHGGPAATKIVLGLESSVSDTMTSTTLWMSKDWVSPMCLGPECWSRVRTHSGSVSQLKVKMGETAVVGRGWRHLVDDVDGMEQAPSKLFEACGSS